MSRVYLERLATATITGKSDGEVWDYAISGDTLYIAGSADGIYVFDITDPTAPTYTTVVTLDESSGVEFSGECTDVLVLGSYLFACGRAINFTSSNDAGCIAAYDISTPSSPSWVGAYNPSSMSPRPSVANGYSNDWPQGMATDGTYIYVACQRNGLKVLDVSTPSAITLHGSYDYDDLINDYAVYSGTDNSGGSGNAFLTDTTQTWTPDDLVGKMVVNTTTRIPYRIDSNTATVLDDLTALQSSENVDWGFSNGQSYAILDEPNFLWETSRCAYGEDANGDGWVFMATHGDGVIALSVGGTETPATPGNPQWYDSPLISPIQDSGFTTNARLRARNVIFDDGYIYVSTNCTPNSESADRPERGLCVMDVSDPTAVTGADWVVVSVGVDANDTWVNSGGDRPYMGLTKLRNKVYMAIGSRGTGVFDVTDPTNPVFEGLQGTSMAEGTNLYVPFTFETDGVQYCYYADGFSAIDDNILYVDQIHPEGQKVFIIGNHGTTNTSFVNVLDDRALTPDPSVRTYTAAAGDVVTQYHASVENSGAAREFRFCLYTVSGGALDTIVSGSETSVTNSNTGVGTYSTISSAAVSIGLTAGVEYAVAITLITANPLTGRIITDGAANGGKRDSTLAVAGEFDTVFGTDANVDDIVVSATGINYSPATIAGTITSTIL